MMWTYVLRLPTGETTTVSGIAESPTQYAAILPSGWSIISSTQQQQQASQYPVYRLIIETSPGRVDTGATLPGCTQSTPNLCDGQQFANTVDAYNYGIHRGEIPVIVASADEAWTIADAEERARQLQAQYTGPSQSPAPQPGQGGVPVPATTDGIIATLEQNPVLALGAAFILYKIFNK